jgi:hypothetical protein
MACWSLFDAARLSADGVNGKHRVSPGKLFFEGKAPPADLGAVDMAPNFEKIGA